MNNVAKTHITLSGPNGFALPRIVFADDVEIGRVEPVYDYSGKEQPSWKAIATDGTNHGDRYTSDWNAAKQLALGLGLEVR